MTNEINPKLLRLFACQNALFTPIRCWDHNQNIAGILERRGEFRKRGLPCIVNGGDGAARVAAHEAANKLERSGVVKFSRKFGKRSHWRLSQDEYLRIGYWCLVDGLAETQLAMIAIAGNLAIGATHTPQKDSEWAMVSEAVLSGCDAVTDPALRSRLILRLEEMLLPAMVFDWVRSNSDTAGRVEYQLTPAGWKQLDEFEPFAEPEYDSELALETADKYQAAFAQELANLSSLMADRRHVAIPARPICKPDVEPLPPILDHDAKPIRDWSPTELVK